MYWKINIETKYLHRKTASIIFLIVLNFITSYGNAQTFYGDTVAASLSTKQNEEFLKSIQQKIFYLQNYIIKIADKKILLEERLEMVDAAVKLFTNENNIIQISNAKTGDLIQLPVRQYFRRLAYLNAVKVEITFYKGIRMESIKKGSDGYMYGTALIFQETVIQKNKENIHYYKDRTIKQVNFKSKMEFNHIGDEREQVLEIFLENINVKEVTNI